MAAARNRPPILRAARRAERTEKRRLGRAGTHPVSVSLWLTVGPRTDGIHDFVRPCFLLFFYACVALFITKSHTRAYTMRHTSHSLFVRHCSTQSLHTQCPQTLSHAPPRLSCQGRHRARRPHVETRAEATVPSSFSRHKETATLSREEREMRAYFHLAHTTRGREGDEASAHRTHGRC